MIGLNLPSLPESIRLILVIPFYNEQDHLPTLISSILDSKNNLKEVALIGVNHNSTDKSVDIFKTFTKTFGFSEVITELFPIASVGIPRKTGLDRAFSYANLNKNIVIGSIDADARVHPKFLGEVTQFIKSGDDILVFPSRHMQAPLLEIISAQEESVKAIAEHTLLGIEWLKFQFREILYLIGANETRSSGGVILKASAYKKIGGHKQYFSEQNLPISGESNALGIKAQRLGLSVIVSSYLTELDPRRYIKALKESSDIQGYKKDKKGAKIFTKNDSIHEIPRLSTEEWSNFERKSINGGINMMITRAACYKRLSHLQALFIVPVWHDLIDAYAQYINNHIKDEETYNIIGHEVFSNAYGYAIEKVGANNYNKLVEYFSSVVPQNQKLEDWSKKEILHPAIDIEVEK